MKRIFSVLLIITLAVSLFQFTGCSGGGNSASGNSGSASSGSSGSSSQESSSSESSGTADSDTGGSDVSDDPFAQHMTFSWILPTQQPVTVAESAIMQKVMEDFNVDFDFTELPPTDQHPEKVKLLIASQQIPDIISWINRLDAEQYGAEGAFHELTQFADKLPNYFARIADDPGGRYNAYTTDGKMYRLTDYAMKSVPIFDFSYSKEAVESVYSGSLATFDDLYSMLKAMKEAYPDSYPFGFRGSEVPLANMKSLFMLAFTEGKANYYSAEYPGFDYDAKKYIISTEAPGFREGIEYLARLYDEGLIDPEYMTLDMDNMLLRIKEDKMFLICDYVGGLTGVASLNEQTDYKLYPLQTPQASGKRQMLGTAGAKIGGNGTVVNANIKGDRLDRVFAILDWMYTDEFYDYLYWHPEVTLEYGKLYVDAIYDRTPEEIYHTYMPWVMFATFLVDYETVTKPGTPYADYKVNILTNPANSGMYAPSISMPFTTEQSETMSKLSADVADYYNSNIEMFMLGQKPFAEWDDFVQQMKDKGAQQICDIHNDVYSEYY